jgi:hypothetical protein
LLERAVIQASGGFKRREPDFYRECYADVEFRSFLEIRKARADGMSARAIR